MSRSVAARFGIVVLVLAALPFAATALGLDYYAGFVRRLLILAIAAHSLNFLIGQAGMVALGHAGFIGVGAYVVAAFDDAGIGSAWWMCGGALLATGALATLIGAVATRTRGVYFIMITLAFAQMLYYLAVSLRRYGGDDGYTVATAPSLGFGVAAQGTPLYLLVLAFAVVVFWLQERVVHARFGHAMAGIRDNETRMSALGYPARALRLCAFAGASAVAGLAGSLLAIHDGFVSPSSMLWTQSATLVVMLVIGGIGQRFGALVGVAIWLVLQEVLRQWTEYWHAPLGMLLLAVVFFAPRGVAALAELRPSRAALS